MLYGRWSGKFHLYRLKKEKEATIQTTEISLTWLRKQLSKHIGSASALVEKSFEVIDKAKETEALCGTIALRHQPKPHIWEGEGQQLRPSLSESHLRKENNKKPIYPL